MYTSLSHLLYPSPIHRERLPVVMNRELRNALLQAATTACSVSVVMVVMVVMVFDDDGDDDSQW